jgi:hypothetical protein
MFRLATMVLVTAIFFAASARAASHCAVPANFGIFGTYKNCACAKDLPEYPFPKGSALNHKATCGYTSDGQGIYYFAGVATLTGHIERVESTTWGEQLTFTPDARSRRVLPEGGQGNLLFANKAFAERALKVFSLNEKTSCRSAPAKIRIEGLVSKRNDSDDVGDFVLLREVIDIGAFKNYGCANE